MYSRAAAVALTLFRQGGGLDEVVNDVLPSLVHKAVFVRITLASRGTSHMRGDVEVDPLLVRLVGLFWFLFPFVILRTAVLLRRVVNVV